MLNKTILQNGGASAPEIEMLEKAYKALENAKKRPVHTQPHIVCTGVYNAGKSTLLNALLDTDRFPTGSIPTTTEVAQAEFEGAVYVDTPGLNAAEADDNVTAEAYRSADIYLFVSNAENGGITNQEAEWLRTLKGQYADGGLLKDKLVYVLSQCSRVEPETLATVREKARSDLQKVLGICPERVFCIDSYTYRDGKAKNEPLLLKEGGIDELRSFLQETAKAAAGRLAEDHKKEIRLRRKGLLDQLDTLEAAFRQEQRKEAGKADQAIHEIQREWKALEEELQKAIPSDTLDTFYGFIPSLDGPSNVSKIRERSEAALKRRLKEKFQSCYDRRERVARRAVDEIMEKRGPQYCTTGLQSEYHTICDKVNHILETYVIKFQKNGLSVSLSDPIAAAPDLPSDLIQRVREELLDGVVEYGEYYSLEWYINYKADISDTSEYEKGMFGIERWVTYYRTYNDYAIRAEMQKDMSEALKRNQKSASRLVQPYWTEFRDKLIEEIGKRKSEIQKQVDAYCACLKKGGGNSDVQMALNHLEELRKEAAA